MRDEWQKVRLGDAVEVVGDHRGRTPPKLESGKYRVLSAKNIKTGRIVSEDTIGYFDDELYQKYVRLEVLRGDIIITSEAPFGEVYYWNSDEKVALSQRLFSLRLKPEFDSRFAYYYFTSYQFQKELASRASGTTVMGLRQPELLKCMLLCPPLATQKKIAAVLGALDDKIELNRKMNANLEAQAQALFKSWFVDFEPFGGKMPEGWKKGRIGDFCKTVLGGTPSRAKKEYWGGDIAWVNSGMVNEFRIVEASEMITEEGLRKSAAKLLPKKTTVLAITGATLGQVSLLEIEAAANQSVIGVHENEFVPYTFVYPYITNSIQRIILKQTGGAQQHINKDNVDSFEMFVPMVSVMQKYDAKVRPLYELIAKNVFESRKLAETRDALLPKLMKGEIEV